MHQSPIQPTESLHAFIERYELEHILSTRHFERCYHKQSSFVVLYLRMDGTIPSSAFINVARLSPDCYGGTDVYVINVSAFHFWIAFSEVVWIMRRLAQAPISKWSRFMLLKYLIFDCVTFPVDNGVDISCLWTTQQGFFTENCWKCNSSPEVLRYVSKF